MKQKIHTFYDPLPGHDTLIERRQICTWIDAWKDHKFEPIVFTSRWAMRTGMWPTLVENLKRFVGVTPEEYQRLIRWLAMAEVSKGQEMAIMAHWTVLPPVAGWKPEVTQNRKLTFYGGPDLVSGQSTGFTTQAHKFESYNPKPGKKLDEWSLILESDKRRPGRYRFL